MMTSLLAVVETELYIAQAAKLLDEAERAAIVDAVAGAPMMGVLIKGTKGLRKMRIALQGRGKRAGGRLIYWFHSEGYPAVLLMVYAKNTAADLTNEQRRRLIAVSEILLKDFGDGK
ncbi:addiction module toxin RelE [Reyranella sp.]|uniref:addiction module toxin RelE n=1 Tax=Reyranella sp. TaxID=1929291 RepID=UPI00271AE37C|nr:addiction module toxin RelE [Reyranella sp.]MDO8973331.1 addiction module toxin RelE [Reyranella sp.]